MRVRSLPKGGRGGSVRLMDEASMNDSTSISLRAPRGDEFWVLGTGVDTSSWWYTPGFNQQASAAGEMLVQQHQGTNWQSVAISTLRPIRGVSWPGVASMNMGSTTYEMAYGLLFKPVGDFRGRLVNSYRWGYASAVSSITLAPFTNRSLVPGGLYIAAAYLDSAGVGPSTFSGQGWFGFSVGLLALAFYLLPRDAILTPPSLTISAGRSDSWAACMAQLA